MRSCQPGPSSWKCASTSLSSFSDTSSLVFGTAGRSTAGATGFLVGLNNASAASIALTGRRGVVAMKLFLLWDGRCGESLHRSAGRMTLVDAEDADFFREEAQFL